MSRPEQKIVTTTEVPVAYGSRTVPVEVTINKGRLPRSEKVPSNRERKRIKNELLGRTKTLDTGEAHDLSLQAEGILFTFNPHA